MFLPNSPISQPQYVRTVHILFDKQNYMATDIAYNPVFNIMDAITNMGPGEQPIVQPQTIQHQFMQGEVVKADLYKVDIVGGAGMIVDEHYRVKVDGTTYRVSTSVVRELRSWQVPFYKWPLAMVGVGLVATYAILKYGFKVKWL